MTHVSLEIVEYEAAYAGSFASLNKDWIEENYTLEPIDLFVLEHPDEAILKDGGKILFAKQGGDIVGTVGLKRIGSHTGELVKMAVSKKAQGQGIGKLLCRSAIASAKTLGCSSVILYSNTRQSAAINIYRQLGFTELPVKPGGYARANIKMELLLRDGLSEYEINKLIESYAQSYNKIIACLNDIPKDIWDWQPPYKKWTIRQNIIHLADSEVQSYFRCRRGIAQPGSVVLGYDQDLWAERLWYNTQNLDDALELYRLLRKMSYDLIKRLPMAMWNNSIEHSEYGTMKMWQWLRYYENHTHIFQMQRVYNEWRKSHGLD